MSSSLQTGIITMMGLVMIGITLVPRLSKKSSKKADAQSASESEIEDIEDEGNMSGEEIEDVITPEDVCKVFDTLFIQMQTVLAQIGQQIQKLQMSGQTIPEIQLRQILKGEFERALMSGEQKAYEDVGVDAENLELATWEFMEDRERYPAVVKSVERLQKLYESVSGESVVAYNPGYNSGASSSTVEGKGGTLPQDILSKEKALEAATVYFDALTKSMLSVIQSYKDKGANLNDPAVFQELQMKFGEECNQVGEDALGGIGITADVFRASIEKHATNPDVGRGLAALQRKQYEALQAVGLPM